MKATKTLPNENPRIDVGSIAIIDGARWLLVLVTVQAWIFQEL